MNIFTLILIKFIKAYKYLISPLLGHSCRYLPTCSEYSIDALKEFGLLKGSFLSIKRILSCHPIKFLGGGEGFDPVKKREINFDYSFLVIAKSSMLNNEYKIIKETLFQDFAKIK